MVAGKSSKAAKLNAGAKDTRKELELAFARLRHGRPKIVPKGTRISPTSVAQEAGVRRETLYKHHKPVLDQVNAHCKDDVARALRKKLSGSEASVKDLRALAEEAQLREQALARHNHRLAAQVAEVERLLRIRDETIADLRAQLSRAVRIAPIK